MRSITWGKIKGLVKKLKSCSQHRENSQGGFYFILFYFFPQIEYMMLLVYFLLEVKSFAFVSVIIADK